MALSGAGENAHGSRITINGSKRNKTLVVGIGGENYVFMFYQGLSKFERINGLHSFNVQDSTFKVENDWKGEQQWN
jgi:hypothetical protein